MLRNLISVCYRTAEELLRVHTDDVSDETDTKWQCFGEWPL